VGGDPPVGRFTGGGTLHDALNPGGAVVDFVPSALVNASASLRALRIVTAVVGGMDVPVARITALAADAISLARAADTTAGGAASLLRAADERLARTVAADARTAGSTDAVPLAATADPRFDAILEKAVAILPDGSGALLNPTAFDKRLLKAADCATAALSEVPDALNVAEFAAVMNAATSATLAFADGKGTTALFQTHDADGVEENELDGGDERDGEDDGEPVGVVESEGVFDGDPPKVSVVVGDVEIVEDGVRDAVKNEGVLLDDRDAETGVSGALGVEVDVLVDDGDGGIVCDALKDANDVTDGDAPTEIEAVGV
jgi:hypothetical protein